jgi:hypothetical protein
MLSVGDRSKCSFCNTEAQVEERCIYQNKSASFLLSCGHRNGWCGVHEKLVLDSSDTDGEINTMCVDCVLQEQMSGGPVLP